MFDGLECCYCFGFDEEVVGEAAIAVIVGDCDLVGVGLVIGDDINDDDDCDVLGIFIFCVERICPFSFYIIYIIIIIYKNTNHNNYLNIFYFYFYYNIFYIKRDWRHSLHTKYNHTKNIIIFIIYIITND